MQYSIGHRWCQGFKILASQSIKGNNEHCSKSQLQQASNFSSTCNACNGDQHLHHNLRGESATLYLCDEGFKRARSECDGGLSGFRLGLGFQFEFGMLVIFDRLFLSSFKGLTECLFAETGLCGS